VGGGFSNDDRRAFLSDLKDLIVTSDYAEVNDQVAYHMVKPEVIIEISVLDMFSQSTRGASIKKMVLQYDPVKQHYGIVRLLPMVGLISPQYVRRRDDKKVNTQDLRMQQVTDIVEVPLADRDARQLQLPKSELLRREVHTKQLKGATMVRKLLMWKTNKERDTDEFPAYVLHLTDFSPNRKTPLEREIRVSSSRDQIEELWRELAEESFVKGWTPAAASFSATAATGVTRAGSPPPVAAPAPAPEAEALPAKKSRKKVEPAVTSEPPPPEPAAETAKPAKKPPKKANSAAEALAPAPKKRGGPKKKAE
jgi:hypothetical protein